MNQIKITWNRYDGWKVGKRNVYSSVREGLSEINPTSRFMLNVEFMLNVARRPFKDATIHLTRTTNHRNKEDHFYEDQSGKRYTFCYHGLKEVFGCTPKHISIQVIKS